MNKLSDSMDVSEILAETDIGATNATSSFTDMSDGRLAMFVALVNTFNAGDVPLDTAKLVQAKDSGGTSVKDITGKNLDGLLNADERGFIDLDASELDTDGGFTFAAIQFIEAGNTGVDNVQALLLKGRFRDGFRNVGGADQALL